MVTTMEAIESSELQRLGVPLDGEVLEQRQRDSPGLEILISDNVIDNIIEDATRGGTYWIIRAIISNLSLRRIRLAQCHVAPPWDDPAFNLLEASRRNSQREYTYSPPEPSHPFAHNDVLNHRFGREGWLNPGESIDGSILGVGSESIPLDYWDHHVADVELTFWDGRGKPYFRKAPVRLHPSARLKRQLEEYRDKTSTNHHTRIPGNDKVAA